MNSFYSTPYRIGNKWAVVLISNSIAIGDPHIFATKEEAEKFVENPGTVDTESMPEWMTN